MFFKSNDNRPVETGDPSLFSMERIGRRIMHARKKKGMTQMELADRMGISFQAVSNWERGQSCPDIAKLFELSVLFDVSIDELLGSPRAAQIASEVMDGTTPALPVEELAEVAPLLDQKQADEVIQKSLSQEPPAEQAREEASPSPEPHKCRIDRVEDILPLLPYASEETVSIFAKTLLRRTQSVEQILPLLDYMDADDVGEAAIDFVDATRSLEPIRPLLDYMDADDVGKAALTYANGTRDAKQILPLLDYMDADDVGKVAKVILDGTRDPKQITPFLDYMDEDDVNALLRSLLS